VTEVPTAPTTPADLARWAFWVPFRRMLKPSYMRVIRTLHEGWRAQYLTARNGRPLMMDELQRSFGALFTEEGYQALVRDAYRIAWRVHLEELMLGKLTPDTVGQFMRMDGREHLDDALSQGRGVVWVYPHAGAIMMMLAWLSLNGYEYTQYAARGLAPEEVAKDHPELLASNRWREAVRDAREKNEDRLPAKFLTLQTSARVLYRRLAENEIVGIAYDGRIGTRWEPVDYLERTALLNPGPYRLACSTGALVVPAFCHTPPDGPAVCEVGAPLEPGKDWRALMKRVLKIEQAWIRRWPEEYGIWLLHARIRNDIDDHPLFIDQAEDDRHKRWLHT